MLSEMLLKENICVPEYIKTSDGKPYIQADETYYVLMKKLNGHHIDPYTGNSYENGIMLGGIVADLHIVLGKISNNFECYDSDYIQELNGWIMEELKEKNIQVTQEIINYCYEFETLYKTLPRQLIHRDIHLGNLLFKGNNFVGYLDFDISQKNARILDICYLGATMLVGNYTNDSRLKRWCEIFRGVLFGYGKKLKLTENEINAIPNMFILIELTFSAFFSQIGQQDLSVSCIDMTEWLYRNKYKIVDLTK